jgi:hypothetical protein
VRKILAFASAAAAGWGLVRLLMRRRETIAPVSPAADPRADELRQKLAESRSLVDERERFEAGETTIDRAEPAPADPDARRRRVHDEGRAVVERMRGSPPPA